jgi:hypothetical protein
MAPISTRWLPALAAVFASACGNGGGAEAGRTSSAAADASTICLGATDVSQTVGFPVRVLAAGTRAYGPVETCAYQGSESADVFVSLSVGPVDPKDDPLARVQSAAKTFLGAQAEADRIAVGDGGYAYGSTGKSEAAARKGDRVYHVDIGAMGSTIGDKKAAVITLLQRIVK